MLTIDLISSTQGSQRAYLLLWSAGSCLGTGRNQLESRVISVWPTFPKLRVEGEQLGVGILGYVVPRVRVGSLAQNLTSAVDVSLNLSFKFRFFRKKLMLSLTNFRVVLKVVDPERNPATHTQSSLCMDESNHIAQKKGNIPDKIYCSQPLQPWQSG